MSQAEEEVVDAFGRTLARRFERTESRVREDDRPRERARSPGRYDTSRYDDGPRGRRGGYGDDMYYNDYPRGRQQYPSEDIPRHNNRGYDDYYASSHNNAKPNSADSFPARNSSGETKPLMSFKNFVQSQPEDLPVDEFQHLYEQYTIKYMNYFSESFFKQSKAEEWFQDRYNPINIVEMERSAAENGRVEAEKFKQSLMNSPEDFVAACSLEPSARRNRKSLVPKNTDPTVNGNEENVDNAVTSLEEVSGKHLSGHESRTVYLSGVHACCPKAVLTGAIIARLREAAETSSLTVEDLTPERILISQPMWSHRVLDKFERSAWVVLPVNAASANIKVAMDTLNNLEVVVPLKTAEVSTEAATATFTFKLQASLHMVSRNANTMLPDYLSYSVRMQEDIKRATLLAKLLDEDRAIPDDCRLSALLRHESLNEAVRHMHEHLDVIIAYLRRVHYIAFYGARRFRDEAHLLLMAPCVVHRSKPFFRCEASDNDADRYNLAEVLGTIDGSGGIEATGHELLLEPASSSTQTTAEEEAAIAAAEAETDQVAGATKLSSSAEDEEEAAAAAIEETSRSNRQEEEEEDATTNNNRMDDSAVVVVTTPSVTNTSVGVRVHGRFIVTADRKMEHLIRDMKKRILAKRARHEQQQQQDHQEASSHIVSFADEDDAKKLQALQEITFEKFVHANSIIEQNEKCRCQYPGCGKLFQNAVFIVKHFRLKHPGCADAELLADAEPFMRRRFDEEDLIQRPLPPVEMDINNRVDLKTVREVMENCQKYKTATTAAASTTLSSRDVRHRPHAFDRQHSHRSGFNGNNNHNNNNNNYRPRNSFGSGGGGHHHQQYNSNKRNRDSFEQAHLPTDGSEGFKITASHTTSDAVPSAAVPAARHYLDADAPKETTSGAINYGSIIPGMAKRRKLSGKVTDPLLASPPPAAPKTEGN